jgi:hypothetical protein
MKRPVAFPGWSTEVIGIDEDGSVVERCPHPHRHIYWDAGEAEYAAGVLKHMKDVTEAQSSSISTRSPFGI